MDGLLRIRKVKAYWTPAPTHPDQDHDWKAALRRQYPFKTKPKDRVDPVVSNRIVGFDAI